jgi:hypothetical protein
MSILEGSGSKVVLLRNPQAAEFPTVNRKNKVRKKIELETNEKVDVTENI